VLFRSWDIVSGFPQNMGGLQILKEYILSHLTFPCSDGKLIAYSDGAHIYEQYFDLVNLLNIEKIDKMHNPNGNEFG
jgi:thymidylate synthase